MYKIGHKISVFIKMNQIEINLVEAITFINEFKKHLKIETNKMSGFTF